VISDIAPRDETEHPESERFFAGAVRRIVRAIMVFALILFVPAWYFFGLPSAFGFAAGAAVSWMNFHYLARGVDGLGERIVNAQSQESGAVVIGRFLLRYLLVGAIAYAIFVGYPLGFRGFLFGLCLPVAAMLTEAVYEAHATLRRGL
jgi:hypothetical protein